MRGGSNEVPEEEKQLGEGREEGHWGNGPGRLLRRSIPSSTESSRGRCTNMPPSSFSELSDSCRVPRVPH